MSFDMTNSITFGLTEATLAQAVSWQKLIQVLMTETDTFLVASVRDGDVVPETSALPAITLLLVAEQGTLEQPVGIASIEDGEIGMAILKQFQGAGLGHSLMSALLDWANETGLEKVWLDVQIDNEPAIHIYKKFEFENSGAPVNLALPTGRVTTLQRMEKILNRQEGEL